MITDRLSAFIKARLTLTFWYSLIILLILVCFSAVLYTAETNNFDRIVLQRNYGNNLPKKLTDKEITDLNMQIRELRKSFIIDLVAVDLIILIIGGGLSLFLAGKTLEPIQESLKKQKEFIADASHEIKTPIAGIQLASEIALRKKGRTKKDLEKVIGQSYEESKHLGKIVEELLLLSRNDSGNMNYKFSGVRLDEIVNEELERIKPLVESKKIIIKHNDIQNTFILGDKDKIRQLVVILIDNAIKYNKKGGYLEVKVTPKPVPFLQVSDTGIGISKQDINRIFDRFYRSDKSRSGNGSGLGLSIAKTISEMHKAKITVKSFLGKGSSFKVAFPKNT